jgi:ssDNA-binding replication factor A large subunit
MFKVPLPELKEKIVASGKLSGEELEIKIKAKINELSGLVSEEGAAHILANELGVQVVKPQGKLKIKEIYSGMRNVSTVGKIVRKFDVREFERNDKKGKVCSLIIGDETGTLRVVFWNEQVDLLTDVKEEDIIIIKEGYVRENNNNKEIHLGEKGEIEVNPEGVNVEARQNTFQRKSIKDLQSGEEGAEILGTVVQVFDPRFFSVCPRCNRKVTQSEGTVRCQEHGEVEEQVSYVVNAVLDDGSGNIRAVFWKNQTNHLLDKTEEEMRSFKENPGAFEDTKTDLLGEQFKLMGRVRHNEMFDRLEFNAQLVNKAVPEEELAKVDSKD